MENNPEYSFEFYCHLWIWWKICSRTGWCNNHIRYFVNIVVLKHISTYNHFTIQSNQKGDRNGQYRASGSWCEIFKQVRGLVEQDTETTQGEIESCLCLTLWPKATGHGANSDRPVRTHGVRLSSNIEISRSIKRVVERMREIEKQKPRASSLSDREWVVLDPVLASLVRNAARVPALE